MRTGSRVGASLADVPGATSAARPYVACKRAIDLVIATLALLVLAPVMAIIALVIRIDLGAPIIFRQTRPGRNEQLFTLYKFRTMRTAFQNGRPLADAERLTRCGRILRATSLDELPELINVLKGEMSLVGPRPLLVEYLPLYSAEQRRRHSVRPGITGWAQVNGRNAIAWPEKFAFDLYYVDHMSFLLDARILTLTLIRIAKRDGVSQRGHATMEPFSGNLT